MMTLGAGKAASRAIDPNRPSLAIRLQASSLMTSRQADLKHHGLASSEFATFTGRRFLSGEDHHQIGQAGQPEIRFVAKLLGTTADQSVEFGRPDR